MLTFFQTYLRKHNLRAEDSDMEVENDGGKSNYNNFCAKFIIFK